MPDQVNYMNPFITCLALGIAIILELLPAAIRYN